MVVEASDEQSVGWSIFNVWLKENNIVEESESATHVYSFIFLCWAQVAKNRSAWWTHNLVSSLGFLVMELLEVKQFSLLEWRETFVLMILRANFYNNSVVTSTFHSLS